MDGDFGKPIEWSEQQLAALDRVTDWYQQSDQLKFFLSGCAGTGKTTLALEMSRRVGRKVIFASVTGRACAVMARKGCDPVDTIDHLIYRRECVEYCADVPPCKKVCPGRCQHKRQRYDNKRLDPESPVADADLVIIDEVSMLGRQMGEDLLSFGVPTLVLGDIGQLPAIGDAGYFTNRRPDYHMDEIHRQAADSPIVHLATRARQGRQLRHDSYGDSAVMRDIGVDELVGFDQVIVGTHRQRRAINRRVRRHLGFRGIVPAPGEKILCLKNDRHRQLRNGELYWAVEAHSDGAGFVEMTVRDEDDRVVDVVAPEAGFHGDGNANDLPEQPFDFGHAITCHKAQGSEWGDVVVFDESAVFRGNERCWLYTAVTRAAERVVVVRP
jgi:exodeoxyribonuclease V